MARGEVMAKLRKILSGMDDGVLFSSQSLSKHFTKVKCKHIASYLRWLEDRGEIKFVEQIEQQNGSKLNMFKCIKINSKRKNARSAEVKSRDNDVSRRTPELQMPEIVEAEDLFGLREAFPDMFDVRKLMKSIKSSGHIVHLN